MSGVTLPQLLAANPGGFRQAADGWRALAEDVDNAAEEFIRSTRDIAYAWPSGPASTAAQEKIARLKAQVCNAYNPARRIYEALRHHGDAVEDLQEQARNLIDAVQRAGFTVDTATGQVSSRIPATDSTAAQNQMSIMQGYADQLASLLQQARTLDDSTSNVITVNMPDGPDGFGTSQLPPLSLQDLQSMRGRDPRDINAWWSSLTPMQQEQAISDYPELVGALNGIPVTDRDVANRIVLDRDITAMRGRKQSLDARAAYITSMADQGRLSEVYPGTVNPTAMALDELDSIKAERGRIDGTLSGSTTIQARLQDPNKPAAFLIGFSPADDGRAIVAVGDPDHADNVVTYVPGTTSDLPGVGADLKRADLMAEDANRLDLSGRRTSAIMWLGYDAPDIIPNAASASYAHNAVGDLQGFQSGLRVTHDGVASHNTVIGHSYGTTTVGFAARDSHGLAANDLIFVGSPGVGVDTASQLHIQGGAGNVWASTAANDVIRFTGVEDNMRFGENPANAGFGGRMFTSADGSWNPVATHSEYWDQHNPSRRNIAMIVTGQTSRVQ